MIGKHLSLETLARWLAGDLPHDDVVREIAPHLEATCADCRAAFDELRRWQRTVGHWSETVAAFEGPEAPAQLASLADLPLSGQLGRVEADESFHTWGFCHLLVAESHRAVFEDPTRAAELAELAVFVSERLPVEAYDPSWVADLRARAWAHLGNARRVLGELLSGDAAFRSAFSALDRSQTGNPLVRAELLHLLACQRRAQRRLDEALALAEEATAAFLDGGDGGGAARAHVTRAKVLEERGDLDAALAELGVARKAAEELGDRKLALSVAFNEACCLAGAARFEEAEALWPELSSGIEAANRALDRVRLRWLRGRIDAGSGREAEAEAAFREVQAEFYERRLGYDAALVSLDLGILLAGQRRTRELKDLSAEIFPLFELQDVHREAIAALLLFQRAIEEERLTVELAQQVAAFLRRERRPSA